jgi:ribosomal protein L19E
LRVRAQRRFLKMLRDKGRLSPTDYRKVYLYVKAGNFKSVAALKEYLNSKGLLKEVV